MKRRLRPAPPSAEPCVFGWAWGPALDITEPIRNAALERAAAEAPVLPDPAGTAAAPMGPHALGWAWGPAAESHVNVEHGGDVRADARLESGGVAPLPERRHVPTTYPGRAPRDVHHTPARPPDEPAAVAAAGRILRRCGLLP